MRDWLDLYLVVTGEELTKYKRCGRGLAGVVEPEVFFDIRAIRSWFCRRTLHWHFTSDTELKRNAESSNYISHDDNDELADRLSARAERQVNSCGVFPLEGAGL